ncbi:hypothetical protein [Pantoea agglomerans]|uniref:hypothetical protein n=1 Tax=Enterobacter agglomerans TaxID=549 RepID=UPI0025434451|nr:hypothetical protein [Pantoea agglomerans]MDK4215868.1 hypothetical protein [Pantoea agglomerans]
MRERPIIFNADMVRSVLDGKKTQTRRIMREQPEVIPKEDECGKPGFWIPFNAGKTMVRNEDMYIACPFGLKGDRLWVRETWSVVSHAFDDDGLMIDYVPDRPAKAVHEKPFGRGYYSGHAIYAADGGFTWGDDDGCVDGRSCWKPSIHMPRWASRITLEITGVRVERLWDITEEDAKAEGCTFEALRFKPGTREVEEMGHTAVYQFGGLWQSIYGADSWQANPWVWVVEFKRVEVE